MEVLGFQIFFFTIILISGLFGRTARNTVTIGSVIFTFIMVFMNWLILLQLITIGIAFSLTQHYLAKSQKKLENNDEASSKGCLYLIVGGVTLAIILKIYSDNYKNENPQLEKSEAVIDLKENFVDSAESVNYVSDPNPEYFPTSEESIMKIDNGKTSQATISKSKIIENFITAENGKDLKSMNLYLSESMLRFWDIPYPNKNDFEKTYYKTWSQYEYTYTQILNIDDLGGNMFKVKVKFDYDNKSKINYIYFVFDNYGKIIEIY